VKFVLVGGYSTSITVSIVFIFIINYILLFSSSRISTTNQLYRSHRCDSSGYAYFILVKDTGYICLGISHIPVYKSKLL